jgi:hypothetical protein
MMFMNTLAPTEAMFSARARRARRPWRARAMPRQAKTRAAAGMAASRPATTARRRSAWTMRYWAVKLTAAAAPASAQRPMAALRSQAAERSREESTAWSGWVGLGLLSVGERGDHGPFGINRGGWARSGS